MRPLVRFPSRDVLTDDIRQRLRDLPSERQPPYDWMEFRRRAREQPWPKRSAVKWEHAAAAAGITVLIASMAMWGRSDHQHAGVASSGVSSAPLIAANGAATSGTSALSGVPATSAHAPEDSTRNAAPSVHDGAAVASAAPVIGLDGVWTPKQMAQLNAQINADATKRAEVFSKAAQAAVSAQVAALAAAPASRRWLAQQPAEPAVVRVGSRLAVANLEDRIAWVDDALSDAETGHADAAGLRTLRLERARLVGSLAQVRYAETLAAQVP